MIPIAYNYRNLFVRWKTTAMTAVTFTLVVASLIAMQAFVRGVETVCALSGEPQNVLAMKQGANDEIMSQLDAEVVTQVENFQGVERDATGRPFASRELYMVVSEQVKTTGQFRMLQVRGVLPRAFDVHTQVKIESGRMMRRGLGELIVGRGVRREKNLDLGTVVHIGRKDWRVVGVFSAAGSAFESELWADLGELASNFRREGVYNAVVVRTPSPAAAADVAERLASSRQLAVNAQTEPEYYAKQSEQTEMIRNGSFVIALFMGIGAVFGITNTMFAAIGQRIKDIAVMRILGFTRKEILFCFLLEALLIAFIGGLCGAGVGYAINGITVNSAVGVKTLDFAFQVDRHALGAGALFTLGMGLIGGILPALSAMRVRPLESLR